MGLLFYLSMYNIWARDGTGEQGLGPRRRPRGGEYMPHRLSTPYTHMNTCSLFASETRRRTDNAPACHVAGSAAVCFRCTSWSVRECYVSM